MLVLSAQDVFDAKGIESGGAALRFFVERAQIRAVNAVLALHLLDHELGIGDDAEVGIAFGEREPKGGKQAGVFREIIGFYSQKFVKFLNFVAVGVFQTDAIAGGTGIASRAAVAVSRDP